MTDLTLIFRFICQHWLKFWDYFLFPGKRIQSFRKHNEQSASEGGE